MHAKLTGLVAALIVLPALASLPTAEARSAPAAPAAPAAPPAHTLAVAGAGIATYPAFDPDIERYGITSTDASTGTVTVTATTSDAKGKVFIDGRLAPNGKRTITGLQPNDEVSVIFEDSGGTAAHSAIYLPAGLHALVRHGSGPAPTEHTLLNLSLYDGSPFFDLAVDANGVPVFVNVEPVSSGDFKRQPDGQLTVSRDSAAGPGRTGSALVVLGDDLQETARYETVGLVNTDGHDSILLDDSMYLVAYEPNPETGYTDAVIQQRDHDGNVLWEWNSGDHVDPATETVYSPAEGTFPSKDDYAHINSIQVMDDGDILASFRHFSAAFKIARVAHDEFDEGDIVWKFGGRFSDFTFSDGLGGPCAQHTVSQLDNGHLLMFDNGAWKPGPLCIDPDDPTGAPVDRTPTRISEYSLDEDSGQAELVWNFEDPQRYAIFAGSAERLANGNTLVGWASAIQTGTVVTEITPAKETAWELVDETPPPGPGEPGNRPFTYRAARTTIPDVIDPVVTLPVKEGHEYHRGQQVRPAFSCTDRGGSSLHSCVTTGITGDRLDTSRAGTHTVSVTATDGAGNTTTRSRSYVVVADRPDAMLKAKGSKRFVGNDVYGPVARQTISQPIKRAKRTAVTVVRLQNDGPLADRIRVKGTKGNKKFRVVYRAQGKNVTKKVVAGTFRTPALKPGKQWVMRVKVTRTKKASRGNKRALKVRATANHNATHDTVRVVNRAR